MGDRFEEMRKRVHLLTIKEKKWLIEQAEQNERYREYFGQIKKHRDDLANSVALAIEALEGDSSE